MNKIVLVTGGFDPLHSGHIEYLREAKKLGSYLIVGLNSDEWLRRKKGQPFMCWEERQAIVSNLKMVDEVISFDDSDGSAIDAIRKALLPLSNSQMLVFANGGDRTPNNIPEMTIQDPRVEFAFGVGGANKLNSSSWLLNEWKGSKTQRPWGHYRVVYDVPGCKVKELVVEPGRSLSMQKHQYRNEYWFIAEGIATVHTERRGYSLTKHKNVSIARNEWHQLQNLSDKPLKIVEIQYGVKCEEADIERR